MRNPDRFRGCLIGGAAGDALGYAVEFMHEEQIFSRYGDRGITDYDLGYGRALISDDTQMTLFTAAGLLAGNARDVETGSGESYAGCIRDSYLDWLKTQEQPFPLPEGTGRSWLCGVRDLFSRRAPGTTCMSALKSGGNGTVEMPVNQSKGCGGVMRVAPVGLYFNDRGMDGKDIARIGAEAAAITHGHILGWMSAAVLVQIIHEISQDGAGVREAVDRSLETAEEMWPESEKKQYLIRLVRQAVDLAGGDTEDLQAIHRLGAGWVGEEALAIAVYCAAKHENDFDRAVIAAVNHNGDSDSTGAVTGNILGARLGLSGIPEKYTEKLELRDVILQVADDLCGGLEEDPERDRRYSGTR